MIPLLRPTILLLVETNPSLYWVLKYGILSLKVKNLKAVTENLRDILIHSLVTSVTTTVVNTLQERPRLLLTHRKL